MIAQDQRLERGPRGGAGLEEQAVLRFLLQAAPFVDRGDAFDLHTGGEFGCDSRARKAAGGVFAVDRGEGGEGHGRRVAGAGGLGKGLAASTRRGALGN